MNCGLGQDSKGMLDAFEDSLPIALFRDDESGHDRKESQHDNRRTQVVAWRQDDANRSLLC